MGSLVVKYSPLSSTASLLGQKYSASSPVDFCPFTKAIDHVIHRFKAISEVIGLFAIISVLLDSRREGKNSELDSSDFVAFIFLCKQISMCYIHFQIYELPHI
jgi:hypothetical protein